MEPFRDYEIIEVIGQGGMGVVFRARHKLRRREVALKVIHDHLANNEELRARFLREARILDRLDHPNILALRDYFEDRGRLVIATDFLTGRTLAEVLGDGAPLPRETSLVYLSSILQGVAHAHGQGIIHRDLKPSNIFVTREGNVKILDFGLSKELRGGARMTATGQMIGTPIYMPPEALRTRNKVPIRDVGTEGDIYAVGVIAYRLLSGQLLYHLDEEADAVDALAELAVHYSAGDPVEPLGALGENLPADTADLVMQCLSQDPKTRPDAASVLVRLTEATRGRHRVEEAPSTTGMETYWEEGEVKPARAPEPRTGASRKEDEVEPKRAPEPRSGANRKWTRLGIIAAGTAAIALLAFGIYQMAIRNNHPEVPGAPHAEELRQAMERAESTPGPIPEKIAALERFIEENQRDDNPYLETAKHKIDQLRSQMEREQADAERERQEAARREEEERRAREEEARRAREEEEARRRAEEERKARADEEPVSGVKKAHQPREEAAIRDEEVKQPGTRGRDLGI
jgi:tRNA A-37 threonylcarbamoyl transferase component Bud32